MLSKEIRQALAEYVNQHKNIYTTYALHDNTRDYGLAYSIAYDEVKDFIETKQKRTFKQVLFHFIDSKNMSDAEIYRKANIDRRHFHKIRSKPEYRPGKSTVIALALALELDKNDTITLLNSAGYTLSDSDTFDLVIQFCLEKKIYDIHDVNLALDFMGLKPLTGC